MRLGIHFLDNVIGVSRYPLPQIEQMSRANRKVGLGVMGFADVLLALDIPYGSAESVRLADRVLGLVHRGAVAASRELAKRRGPFPNFGISCFAAGGEPPTTQRDGYDRCSNRQHQPHRRLLKRHRAAIRPGIPARRVIHPDRDDSIA